MAKKKLYIQFYNIKGSSKVVERGPFDSIICDFMEVIGVKSNETPYDEEIKIASFSQVAEQWRVYDNNYSDFFHRYFEVIQK
jgi:hypothetical protein